MKEAVKKAPFQVMRDGILATLRNSPLANKTDPMLGEISVLLRRRLGDYLYKQSYNGKDEYMVSALRRGD